MESTIAKIAERVLGYYFDAEDIEIRTGKTGTIAHIDTCVKAYGDGWSSYFDSAYPDECEPGWRQIKKGPALSAEIMQKYPAITRVLIHIDGD